ncbi:heterokaryon incompatibility protein [Colletotrichum melonis]|uniref:Heterokaryon incompatibility protein n=1 Tax=Colletotrichum melonis TaxID=1209925 RepID=A0AAI9XP68_9PEZI|nr:heterokaryon incompatibility protein [Colletotrichum melonis]
MSSGIAKFEYSHRIGKETIRLVRILGCGATGDGPLQLSLEEHALGDLPDYRGLSYTWGSPLAEKEPSWQIGHQLVTISVMLNGQSFDIFPNLHDALCWIRAHNSCDLYWIDAISINQADDTERSMQVGIMDRIYKKATRVDIWLGSVTDEHHPAEVSRLVRAMAENTQRNFSFDQENSFFDDDALSRYGLLHVPDDVWYAFVAFFERKWFNRVWVVQEVALSRDACILWGNDVIPWETVAYCSDFLYESRLYEQLSEVLYDNNPTIKDVKIGSNSSGIVAIQRCRHDILDMWDSTTLDHIVGPFACTGGSSRTKTAGALLFLMLRLTVGVEATDPRDQVFGLLGILNLLLDLSGRTRTELEANYRKHCTPVSIYTDTAVFIMEECKNLALLTAVPDDSVKNIQALPSWVPDFSANGPSAFLAMRWPAEIPYFDACRSMPTKYRVVDDRQLHVKALCVGTASLVGEVYSELATNGSFTQWADFLLQCDPVYKPTGQCRVEAFWRTLIGDRDGFTHPAPGSLQKAFHSWIADHVVWEVYCAMKKGADIEERISRLDSIKRLAASDVSKTVPSCDVIMGYLKQLKECEEQEQVEGLFDRFKHTCQVYVNLAFETLWERRPFLTDSSHIGLGGRSVQEGDGIWVVAGCPSPIVLRELPVSSISRPLSYRLIGEAYVHGIMHGEAVGEDMLWEDVCIQ